jgi:hypothetical protein
LPEISKIYEGRIPVVARLSKMAMQLQNFYWKTLILKILPLNINYNRIRS